MAFNLASYFFFLRVKVPIIANNKPRIVRTPPYRIVSFTSSGLISVFLASINLKNIIA